MTFSIVACEPHAQQMGVAVASKFLAVGAVVPWLEAEVGAIATQALANTRYGPHGLAHMREGMSAREALDAVLAADPGRDDRQAGFVDARGRAATHTGQSCMAWAGGRAGAGYAVQGNILTGPGVVDAMAEAYEAADGRARRAPAAGAGRRRCRRRRPPRPSVGCDRRRLARWRLRRQRRPARRPAHGRPRGSGGRAAAPYDIHILLTGTTPEDQKLPLDGALGDEVRELLARAGYPGEDGAPLSDALRAFVGIENLEARWWYEDRLDPVVLEHLRSRAAG